LLPNLAIAGAAINAACCVQAGVFVTIHEACARANIDVDESYAGKICVCADARNVLGPLGWIVMLGSTSCDRRCKCRFRPARPAEIGNRSVVTVTQIDHLWTILFRRVDSVRWLYSRMAMSCTRCRRWALFVIADNNWGECVANGLVWGGLEPLHA
jgi:hypothetical protein